MSQGIFERLLPAPVNGGFRMDDYWVWCGSVVLGEDGKYHMFASRWPKWLPMHPGWLVCSEIVRAVAVTPEGPYHFEEVVLPSRGAQYWDGRSTHNPHIIKHEDTYLLYYMGSTHPFGEPQPGDGYGMEDYRCISARANKRIGLAVSKSVHGPWIRMDSPIVNVRPGRYDSYLVSNPAPCVHDDGSVLMIYKSRQYEGNTFGNMTIGVSCADQYEGPYRVLTDDPVFPSERFHIEDPFLWKSENGYELIAKDMEGNLCGEKHGGIHAHSPNGLSWKLSDDPKSYSRTVKWNNGTIQTMGNFERPFLLFHEGKPTHLFAAVADGPGGFRQAKHTWNMVIPIAQE